jgi:beta-phosphoglucomutase-like phosphatase (HAD superfamily)
MIDDGVHGVAAAIAAGMTAVGFVDVLVMSSRPRNVSFPGCGDLARHYGHLKTGRSCQLTRSLATRSLVI